MKLNEYSKLASEISKSKGFQDIELNIPTKLALIHSEVSEALEADRIGTEVNHRVTNISHIESLECDKVFKAEFEYGIKDTFEDELADILIRVFELCGIKNIDIDSHVKMKMRYNSLRPRMNGGKRY